MLAPLGLALANGGATIEFENTPLFSAVNFLPGDDVSRWIKVTNNSGESGNVSIEAIGFASPIPLDDLSRVLNIVIKNGATIL